MTTDILTLTRVAGEEKARQYLAITPGTGRCPCRRGRRPSSASQWGTTRAQGEQSVGVGADLGAHVGEGVEVVISGQVPVRTDRVGVDPGRQLGEGGVGVDGHHPAILTQLRDDRPDAGRDGGFCRSGSAGWWSWSISPDGVSWSCSNCVTIFTHTTWGDDG